MIKYTLRLSRKSAVTHPLRAIDRTLSQRQLAFFEPFGAELCSYWSVLESNPQGGIQLDPASTTYMGAGAGGEWPGMTSGFAETIADPEVDFGLGNLMADDAYGRMWWSEWMTQP